MIYLLRGALAPAAIACVLVGCPPDSGGLIGDTPTPPVDDDDATDDDDAVVGPFANLTLNEVISSGNDMIEIMNLEPTEQDIGGWQLRDDDEDHRPWVIPAGTIVAAGGFISFVKDQHDIGLGDEDAAVLIDPSGEVVEEAPYGLGTAGLSWCKFPDATGGWTNCTSPTPGAPNILENPTGSTDPLFIAGLDRFAETDVRVGEPNELAFDENGLLWAGDQESVRVQIFDVDGTFLQSVGGQGTGPGQFAWSNSSNRGPESMKPYNGKMYVVDRIGRRVNVYDTATFAAEPSIGGDVGLVDPTGLVISDAGLIYIGDQSLNTIEVINTAGTHINTFQTHDGGTRILNKVETLAIDQDRNRLFATSEQEQRLEVFELSTGDYLQQHITQLQSGGGIEPGRITVSIEGTITDEVNQLLFVCDEEAGRFMIHDLASASLVVPTADFAYLNSFGSVGGNPGQFRSADGIAVSAVHDRVAVADQGNDRVQVFSLSELAIALEIPLVP